jgi:ubiquinone biosynthesis protein COQ9
VRALLAVWLWGIRAWERDESDDLSGTMAAVDTALQRAEQVASWLDGKRGATPPPATEEPPAETEPSALLLPEAEA